MKTGLWLSQRQVRWLIVLLALLPLIPSALLVQMMVVNSLQERESSIAEITSIYRGQLSLFVERFSQDRDREVAAELTDYLEQIFGSEVTLVVSDRDRLHRFGDPDRLTRNAIVYEIARGGFRGWTISLDGVPEFPDHIEEQRREALWYAIGILVGVIIVAGLVWFTVHRRLRLDVVRSDLITTIAHEIKTPVAAMKVLIETLEGGQLEEKTKAEYFSLLDRENDRVAELADQFLTFSRLERGQIPICRIDCALHALLADQVALLAPRFDLLGGELTWDCPRGISLKTDPKAVKVVVANLLENAAKYGGDPPFAHLEVKVRDSRIEIRVTDRGSGIPVSERRAVFHRFYQSDAQLRDGRAGIGLGLAISRRFARLLKSRLFVAENPTGKGARFILSLPA